MREEIKKILFIGLEEDKESFFKRAQTQGFIHFIDPHAKVQPALPEEIQRLSAAIKILRGLPFREQEENHQELHADQLVEKIIHLHEQQEKVLEELRVLAIEKSRIAVLGNFSFEDIHFIEKHGNCVVQFFCGHPSREDDASERENLHYITSEHGLDFFLSIDEKPVSYDKLIEMKFSRSLEEISHLENEAAKKERQHDHELKTYAKFKEFLHQALVKKLNHDQLNNVQTYVQQALGGNVFAIEGWIPDNKMEELHLFADSLHVHIEEIAIEPTDIVPTYLANQGLSRLGEDLVHIYDTPSRQDKDPSLWVLGGFALFFAMIIGDAGYGLVYLCLALFLRYKFPQLKDAAKRALNLFTLLCVGCVIWGTLTTSFFGMQIALDNPLRKLSLIQWLAEEKADYHLQQRDEIYREWVATYPDLAPIENARELVHFSNSNGSILLPRLSDHIMFELALFIGVVHLITSFLRYVGRNPQNIGWAAFLVGAYLYFPFHLQIPSVLNYVGGIDLVKGGEVGFQLMMAGIGLAWLISILKHGWTGIFEIMVLIQVFADTLSYLRLYALGLAGAIVASTINEIASDMPFLIGIALILISHFINIVLATMSGVIHGLRLNFLEWYHYSFEGGGKKFRPLQLLRG